MCIGCSPISAVYLTRLLGESFRDEGWCSAVFSDWCKAKWALLFQGHCWRKIHIQILALLHERYHPSAPWSLSLYIQAKHEMEVRIIHWFRFPIHFKDNDLLGKSPASPTTRPCLKSECLFSGEGAAKNHKDFKPDDVALWGEGSIVIDLVKPWSWIWSPGHKLRQLY